MEIDALRFPDVWILAAEAQAIDEAFRLAGHEWRPPNGFTGARVHDLLEAWVHLVAGYSINAEDYRHDLGVRDALQFVLEHLGPESRLRLERALATIDAAFRERMKPLPAMRRFSHLPLSEGPFFWHTHSINAEDLASECGSPT